MRDTIRRLTDRWRALRDDILEPRPADPLWVRLLRAAIDPDSRDRVLMLAGQAFIAVIPLMILTATLLSPSDGAALGDEVIDRFDLQGDVAQIVQDLFARPPDAESPIGVISILVVLISVNSFARSLRRTIERAWTITPVGRSATADGLLGLLVLLTMLAFVSSLGQLVETTSPTRPLLLAAQVVVGTLGWLLALRLLLARRLAWRTLLPGAVFGAGLQIVAGWGVSLYLPYLLTRNAERYGGVGVAIALVTWLVVMAAVIVAVGVVGAETARELEKRAVRRAGAGEGSRPPAA